VAGALAGACAWAQPPTATRVYTQPAIPGREALDRLNLQLTWRTYLPVGSPKDGIGTVQHLGEQIFVQLRSGLVIAIDPNTGDQQWRAAVGEAYPVIRPLGYNDDVVLVTNGTRIYGLDRATGRQQWVLDLPLVPSTPPVADAERVYVVGGNGRITAYALPLADIVKAAGRPGAKGAGPAEPTTKKATGPGTPSVTDPRSTSGAGAPSVGGRTTTTGGTSQRTATTSMALAPSRTSTSSSILNQAGRTRVTDAPTPLWEYNPGYRILQKPLLTDKLLFAASIGREVVATAKDQRRVHFEFICDAPVSARIGQYGGIVYVPTADAAVYALDAPTGRVLWRFTATDTVTDLPLVTDEDVYVVAERGGLFRVNRETGEGVWRNELARRVLSVNPKFVYATDYSNRLMVLDRANGKQLSLMDTSAFVVPIINEMTDRVLLAAHDGSLLCLRDKAYPAARPVQNPETAAPAPSPPAPASGEPPAEGKPAGAGAKEK
jgi:outer membrane protein assembly factor BamB